MRAFFYSDASASNLFTVFQFLEVARILSFCSKKLLLILARAKPSGE